MHKVPSIIRWIVRGDIECRRIQIKAFANVEPEEEGLWAVKTVLLRNYSWFTLSSCCL